MTQAYREWDFSNMLTVLLRFDGRPVAAAVLRVFGQQLAELPLVATRPDARRQGHARVMVRAIEAMLVQLGVQVSTGARCRGGSLSQHDVCCCDGQLAYAFVTMNSSWAEACLLLLTDRLQLVLLCNACWRTCTQLDP
jgi:GNAT superfamily N-acetyltransferase